jgi:flagellar protein FliS
MRSSDPTLSYRQASARGASPLGQVVSLYDTILRDFLRAIAALQAGDVETRVFELNHALLVIGHLQGVLDRERGGEAANQLERFYAVTRGMIVEANIRATPESLEELVNLYGGLRQAWYQADQQLPLEQQQSSSPAQISPGHTVVTHVPSPANDESETPQFHWST